MAQLKALGVPAVLVVYKIDTVAKAKLLPVLSAYAQAHPFAEVVPVSGLERDGLELLAELMARHLPEREPILSPEMLTDRSVEFRIGEGERFESSRLAALRRSLDTDGLPPSRQAARLDRLVPLLDARRNQLFAPLAALLLWQTQLAFAIERWRAVCGSSLGRWIDAVAELEALKQVGIDARRDIEEMVAHPVYLELRVKTNPKWRRKPGFIQRQL